LERRSVVQGTLMRSTIHLVSARDYPALAAGVRAARRGWWLRAARRTADEDTMVRTAERLRDLLAGGPLPRRELVRILDVEPAIWNGLGLWVDLVRNPAHQRMSDADPPRTSPSASLQHEDPALGSHLPRGRTGRRNVARRRRTRPGRALRAAAAGRFGSCSTTRPNGSARSMRT